MNRPTHSPPPATPVPPITFPEALPVSARRDEIAAALRDHQVIIVSGETGSGKTTQLPKIALQLGRGRGAGGRGLIGHTQPRRLAATSVAKRIAEELDSPLGEVVGFKVRFNDRLARGASVKLMTDGILLAETQGDPLLRQYDTIIIDEAHERSLNIDFLLGYLKQLLPRRPDLKVVITSATIDAERFARHFGRSEDEPAPVIQVSGRLYPVEVRYRPFEESRETDLNTAIADAADELWPGGVPRGDILVFLPGEREIREAAEHLHQHFHQRRAGRPAGPPPVILPLYARLSPQEQDKVFERSGGNRIVLATNVAETSLTVPGIRFVIDSGLARVKRYSYRHKVEQLQIEPISQAAANQRAGRCGRVADGIAIRLYEQQDFEQRPRFTDPEILRSSLAGVILRMGSLHLGDVEQFPFVEPPRGKAIADGWALLHELGAADEERRLTPLGHELAKLPLDPRIGRMLLAARERDCLAEMLVIAASLSVQDVRDRPQELQAAADQKHKPFDDERSEFLGTLKLWRWLEDGRSSGHPLPGAATGQPAEPQQHKLSHRQFEQRLRDSFINVRRVREWRDTQQQLHTVAAEHGWRLNGAPATYEQLHLALLAGLLGNVGFKHETEDWYLGARGIKFFKHPGANLSKKPGKWIVAAELVETTKLFARDIANIEPQWLEQVGGHLIKRQLLEPHWEKKAGEVIALENGTLYGLRVYQGRRMNYGKLDPVLARTMFIRAALVEGDWDANWPFIAHNRRQIAQVEELEHKRRRQDVLVDEALIEAFYERQIPEDVVGSASFERWFRQASKGQPKLLQLTRDELMRHEAAGVTTERFPKFIRLGGIDCQATYLHEPGDARDGVTVTVPLVALNQVSEARCEWLVPGMLAAKIQALAKSLPPKARSRLQPIAEWSEAMADKLPFGEGSLLDALLVEAKATTQLPLARADFKLDMLAPHFFMNIRLVDEHGRQIAMGRHLPPLKAEWGRQARTAFQALASLKIGEGAAPVQAPAPSPTPKPNAVAARTAPASAPAASTEARHMTWDFGELPELLEVRRGQQAMVGFPALIDHGDHVRIEVFDEPETAAPRHRAGLRRLFALQLKDTLKSIEKQWPDFIKLAALYMPLGSAEDLKQQLVALALDRALLADPLPHDAEAFAARLQEGRGRISLLAQEAVRLATAILTEWSAATRKLKDSRAPKDIQDDIREQLARLVPKDFLTSTHPPQLQHLPRYLKAVQARIDKWRQDAARDARLMAEIRPVEQRYFRTLSQRQGKIDERLLEYRWLLEELRVGLFAQELRTPQPVSVKRLDKAWAQIQA